MINEIPSIIQTDNIDYSKIIINIIYLMFKRFFDIIISLIGLIVLIPTILIVKLVYVMNKDFEPIFFTQDRIGKNGKIFKLYKFRTMIPNADEVLFNTLELNLDLKKEYDKNKKLKNDPRITKVGKILRKTSIDELPQVINILKGEMSLIGNRPYLIREVNDMKYYFNDIIKTKPGLTGFWQVNGRSETDFLTRLVYEQYYSNNYNLLLDIKIFFKTFKIIFNVKGAR